MHIASPQLTPRSACNIVTQWTQQYAILPVGSNESRLQCTATDISLFAAAIKLVVQVQLQRLAGFTSISLFAAVIKLVVQVQLQRLAGSS